MARTRLSQRLLTTDDTGLPYGCCASSLSGGRPTELAAPVAAGGSTTLILTPPLPSTLAISTPAISSMILAIVAFGSSPVGPRAPPRGTSKLPPTSSAISWTARAIAACPTVAILASIAAVLSTRASASRPADSVKISSCVISHNVSLSHCEPPNNPSARPSSRKSHAPRGGANNQIASEKPGQEHQAYPERVFRTDIRSYCTRFFCDRERRTNHSDES